MDKLGVYTQDFNHLQATGEISPRLPEVQRQDIQLVPDMLKTNTTEFDSDLLGHRVKTQFPVNQPAPVFLLGFMRTGATLTKLRSTQNPGLIKSSTQAASLKNGYTNMKYRVFLTRRWPESIESKLQERYDVSLNRDDRPLSPAELKQALQQYDAVCPTVCDSLPAEVLNVPNRRCKILGNFGVGYNHIDIAAAKQQGLIVTNTPGVLTESTADIAITLLLMSARRGAEGDRLVRAGLWKGWCPRI